MPERNTTEKKLKLLYTEIGRGHPFYLDGIITALNRLKDCRLTLDSMSVFDLSRGVSAAAWKSVRWLYKRGSSGGAIGSVYAYIRNEADYNKKAGSLKVLGRDVRKQLMGDPDPLVVAHPALVGILHDRTDLIYQHGEIAVPPEAAVAGADCVFVPVEESAVPFLSAGYTKEQVVVTGLCIEPELTDLAESSFHQRQARLRSEAPLCGFYVSSGAEPVQHVTGIIESITSALTDEGRAVVLAREGGRLHRRMGPLMASLTSDGLTTTDPEEAAQSDVRVVLALYRSRAEATAMTAAMFHRFDYLVSPAHERTNWALGLGLPMFVLTPSVGTFAPLNREAMISQKVALPLDEANPPSSLGEVLGSLRENGSLAEMSAAGWGQHRIDGFEHISKFLTNRYK